MNSPFREESKAEDMERFLKRLSEDTPTPGGGSASALAVALSASLISMVAGLSIKKGKIEEKKLRRIKRESLAIQKRLVKAINEDEEAYNEVIKAFRLPKNSEKEHLYRIMKIQKAYKKAIVPPMLVCKNSIKLLDYSKILISHGNPNAISDAGVSALLADAAFRGGLLNIGANLSSLKDKNFLKRTKILIGKLEKKRDLLMEKILDSLVKVFNI